VTLSKSHIIESIQSNCRCSKTESVRLVEIVFDIVKSTLESGENILISGFGKFNIIDKREHRGRIPAAGNGLTLGAGRIVTFKCSSSLKKKINGDE